MTVARLPIGSLDAGREGKAKQVGLSFTSSPLSVREAAGATPRVGDSNTHSLVACSTGTQGLCCSARSLVRPGPAQDRGWAETEMFSAP